MYYADRNTFGFGDAISDLSKPNHVARRDEATQNAKTMPKVAAARAERDAYLVSAESFIGCCVYNHHAEKLGSIKDMMLDTRSGKVSSAVLSFGGFAGFGQKHFVVPWTALTLNRQKHCFVLNVEKSHLRNSPGFQ